MSDHAMEQLRNDPPFEPFRQHGPALTLDCDLVPWDTKAFGFRVAQIADIQVRDWSRAHAEFEAFRLWVDEMNVTLVSARMHHSSIREAMLLQDGGFRFIEMVFSPKLLAPNATEAANEQLRVVPAALEDVDAIRALAETAFSTGRYLLDWRLPPELSHRRYGAWVSNSFNDPRHQVVKACIGNEIVGFFVSERRSDRSVYWHLTAIAPIWQGRGIGRAVWTAMLARNARDGAEYVETTISAHNTAVINLYAQLGFRFQPGQMTFHWLRA